MEKTNREIIKDMCCRLPYGTKVCYEHRKTYKDAVKELTYDTDVYELVIRYHGRCYLRPMSSMTEEERKEYDSKRKHICDDYNRYCFDTIESIDWLNAHHFDYRGLIEQGLALEAPKDMYKIN